MNLNEIYSELYESKVENISDSKKERLKNNIYEAESSIKDSLNLLKYLKPKISESFKTDEYLKSHIKNGVNAQKRALAIHTKLTKSLLEASSEIKKYKLILKKDVLTEEEQKDIKMLLTAIKIINADVKRLYNATNNKWDNFDFKYASDNLDMRQKVFKSGLLKKLYASDRSFYDLGQE